MVPVRQLITQMVAGITSNDLKSLKAYLESSDCTIAEDATSIEYSYNVQPQIYRENADGTVRQVNPDSSLASLGISSTSSSNDMMSSMMNTSVFYQLPESAELYNSQYEVKAATGRRTTTSAWRFSARTAPSPITRCMPSVCGTTPNWTR